MDLSVYERLSQLGAGKDGVSYRVRDREQNIIAEIRELKRAQQSPRRWARLIHRLRLAVLIDHAGATRVLEARLDDQPPVLVMEVAPEECLSTRIAQGSTSKSAAITLGLGIAETLARAQEKGVSHGNLCPSQVRLSEQSTKIDFLHFVATGCTAGHEVTQYDHLCNPPSMGQDVREPSADDVFGLGVILALMLGCQPSEMEACREAPEDIRIQAGRYAGLEELVCSMLAPDPLDRPFAHEVAQQLREVLADRDSPARPTQPADMSPSAGDRMATGDPPRAGEALETPPAMEDLAATRQVSIASEISQPLDYDRLEGQQLGRFHLVRKVGQGGMGTVYQADDTADGGFAAVKVINPQFASHPEALKRFRREARILAEIESPYVVRILDVNQWRGLQYLAMEYVAGQSLSAVLADRGHLPVTPALSIMADVARALSDPHERGVVHRDIKPDNILVDWTTEGAIEDLIDSPSGTVKLVDFGLARNLVESESMNMTRDGAVLGTPHYMAPEQCLGHGQVCPATDVYAMGATLFHLLAGRPPFVGTDAWTLMAQHCDEPPPQLAEFNDGISDVVGHIVSKSLSKTVAGRYENATEFLNDLLSVLRGEPVRIPAQPKLPAGQRKRVLQYDFVWDLKAAPKELWPYVSNTERLNQAIGLQAVDFSFQLGPEGKRSRIGSIEIAGMSLQWEEHPFEWIEGNRLSVLREFQQGPFRWFVSIVELEPNQHGGTRLTHRILIEPRGLIGRTVAAVEIGIKSKRSLQRVYQRIDDVVTNRLTHVEDPFRPPTKLQSARRKRLGTLAARLEQIGMDPELVRQLREFLSRGSPQELARIRPLVLAKSLAVDPDLMVKTCLRASREGLLVLLWDILCPVCRIPSDVAATLRELKSHAHCPACNLDFELDFANSVEMIFRASPQVRQVDEGTYCIGGPAHSPHVAAQLRLGGGEHLTLELALEEGTYLLRGPQLAFALEFDVASPGQARRWEINLSGPDPHPPPVLTSQRQLLCLTNPHDQELLIRVERTVARSHALTAARVCRYPVFRELFPGEILAPSQLVNVGAMTFLATDAKRDASALDDDLREAVWLRKYFELVDDIVQRHGGAVTKIVGECVWTAFEDPYQAVKAALELPSVCARDEAARGLRPCIVIDHGPVVVTTVNERLDYIGATTRTLGALVESARPAELLMTSNVAEDPAVATLLHEADLKGRISRIDLDSNSGPLLFHYPDFLSRA